ncbi:MAG: alpha-galactosidase [Chloroflexi bacterium]|nr:alpha-galactosidase [Chloroflexota bacterium]
MTAFAPPPLFFEAHYGTEPDPTISYRTALTVYEESFIKGRLVGRGWNGAGFLNFYDGRFDPAQHAAPQAFWLEVDGQLLASDWEWIGFEKTKNGAHCTITLKHSIRPIMVKVHTQLDGTPVLTRWLEVTNTGAHHAALSTAYSWSGVLLKTNRWQMHLPNNTSPLYTIGYMDNPHWGNEGDFQWHDLPTAGYRIDGRYRRDRHRHPMFVLRNNVTGEMFIGQLAWSGGYSFEFDLDADAGTTDRAARVWFRAGPDAPPPQRILAPGETVMTPELHMGLVIGDLDMAINAMHTHLRRSVFMPQPRGRGGWIESGIGPEVEITSEYVLHSIDAAADFGAEVFFIDASWYAPPHADWRTTVGDWQVDLARFPDGMKPFRERAHDKGMLWGLWMDAERIAKNSRVAQSHSDWVGTAYDGEKRLSDVLDLTNPAAAKWMENQISGVIETYACDFFRLDYNVAGMKEGIRNVRDGYIESGYWRYYEALYAIYDRLRARYPNVIFESCAGGGGRTDIGMVRRFSHTWVTDWQIAPRAFAITNGMTMALPPEYVDRLVGGQMGHSTADYDFQWRLLMFVRPTLAFFHPLGASWNPLVLARTRHFIQLYKDFVRPFMSTGHIYHHTPMVRNPEPNGWGVLELASQDSTRAICGLFQLSAPSQPEYLLRLRGLDVGKRYRVTFDSSGQMCEIEGYVLTKQGIMVRLEGALTSELILCEAMK